MTRPLSPRIALALCVALAIAVPASQSIADWGLSASEFASQGDSTLRVTGYAFSIWGVLYAGLVAFAVRALLEGRGAARDAAADGPVALASLGCAAWILAAGFDLRWTTVLVIGASLAAALVGLARLKQSARAFTWRDRLTVLWPVSLLAGWLTAAGVVNIVTVLTAERMISPASAKPVAMAGVLAAGALSLAVLFATGFVSYALPVAWGLVGVFVAERGDQPWVGYCALACAGVLLLLATSLAIGRRPRAWPSTGQAPPVAGPSAVRSRASGDAAGE